MAHQNFTGKVQWILVDDVTPATMLHMGQDSVRPNPPWESGQNTLARNLALGLARVKYDRVLFIEDDDAYLPNYLTSMAEAFEQGDIVGQTPARYYNVAERQYKVYRSTKHASLCQTGIHSSLFPALISECRSGPAIDMSLWRAAGGRRHLFAGSDVVGIKGMPGRPGIGVGHAPDASWTDDAEAATLRQWLGDEANFYLKYFKGE